MIHLGITGNIGSGKTTVCHIFEALGIPVYYSDEAAARLRQTPEVAALIQQHFGPNVLHSDGSIDRQALGVIVFNDKAALAALNAIIHPRVRHHYQQWQQQQHAPYTLMESAILFEHQLHQQMDYNICVTAPKLLRIARVMQRDQLSRQAVQARMQHQWPQAKKIALADFLIHNDEKQGLLPQILQLHTQLLRP